MSARKKTTISTYLVVSACFLPVTATDASAISQPFTSTLARETLAKQLGWVASPENNCGGFYLDQPFTYPQHVQKENAIEITSDQTFFSQSGTSILTGQVTVTRQGQQMTANKIFLYRDPNTGKLSAMDMIGDVNLREPNSLIVGKRGHYDFDTKTKSLINILYRTSINEKQRQIVGPKVVTRQEMEKTRKITAMTAWGKAYAFSQAEANVYDLTKASFTTCPPLNPTWRVKASHIVLDKNTGRGYATHARVLVKSVPVFYAPYISFSIDNKRKSGFLWPTVGVHSNEWGSYFLAPYYLNFAPNYDMTITPGMLSKRGFQLTDDFRYLTHTSEGKINLSILPHDRFFEQFQQTTAATPKFSNSTDPTTQAELNRLESDSTTRKGFFWRDNSHFNDNWSSHIDFNYAGDDYYLRNFGSSLNEITANQLLQEGVLYYKGPNWNFTGRLQAYQTLHPIDEANVSNQYRRFPQLILNGDYPDGPAGLEYFINNEITHFDIRNTPGTTANQPIGNRFHTQPGLSLPIYVPYFYINPRVQLALSDYNLYQTIDTGAPKSKHRAIPIVDIASGASLTRDASLFGHAFQQTLEPQVYYTYIPYRNQSSIPIFDTTVNMLTYDQLFNYNRFSGLDRIGDTNQIGVGVTSRFIDRETGLEKVRAGVGEIFYFANRKVTLCNDDSCTDNPSNNDNRRSLSPVSALLNYNVNPVWSLGTNAIWNSMSKQVDNAIINLHYQTDYAHILNLGFSYARNGDILSGLAVNSSENNLKLTDFSFAWPIYHDLSAVGRWSQNWNQQHLQNLLYGLEYDTCCWAVRLVGGRAFTHLDSNNNNVPMYNSEFYIQFALKGLGNIGSGNSGLLSSITGYNPQFGQSF